VCGKIRIIIEDARPHFDVYVTNPSFSKNNMCPSCFMKEKENIKNKDIEMKRETNKNGNEKKRTSLFRRIFRE
jgi:hypothetical protein